MIYKPPPKLDYYIETEPVSNGEGYWNYLDVTVYKREETPKVVAKYQRHYSCMYNTFEPFWQDGPYALISEDYTKTSVLDLSTGTIIATEEDEFFEWEGEQRREPGFCPTGFHAIGWWNEYDESYLDDDGMCSYEKEKTERPENAFIYDKLLTESFDKINTTWALVCGCYWGDDNDWKIQYLDLSDIKNGVLKRDERFGYIALAGGASELKKTHVYGDRIVLPVALTFDLASGKMSDWQLKELNSAHEA